MVKKIPDFNFLKSCKLLQNCVYYSCRHTPFDIKIEAEIFSNCMSVVKEINQEKSIKKVVKNLKNSYPQYDYLIVNDGSKDHTEEICQQNNYNYDIAIQIDGDGQHDPAYIEKVIAPIVAGEADMTIGSRFLEKKGFQTSFMRRLGINIIRGVIKICCGVTITDTTSGFRASSRKLTKFFTENYARDYPEPEAIVTSVLNGYSVKEVPVIMNEREAEIAGDWNFGYQKAATEIIGDSLRNKED